MEYSDNDTAMYKSRILNDLLTLGIHPAVAGVSMLELSVPLLLQSLSKSDVIEALNEGIAYLTDPTLAVDLEKDIASITNILNSSIYPHDRETMH